MICYLRVYCVEQEDTSAKQRIVVPISRVTGNALLGSLTYIGKCICMAKVKVKSWEQ